MRAYIVYKQQKDLYMQKLKLILATLMPGFFLIGYNIGTGSLTAMSKAGANYGCDLLWAVLLSCLITWYLINFFSRFTMATGMTAMKAYRKHIHPVYAWILWTGLSVIILSALMAMIGLLTDVVLVWCAEVWKFNADRRVVGIILALLVYSLILIGNTKRFEAMLSVMVALMGLAFIGSAIKFFPGFTTIMAGVVPRIPEVAEGSDNSSMIILAGMVGTTVSVFAFLIRSGQVKDHGWTMADWKIQKRDALVSASMMFVLSAAVMLTATSTLHEQGLKMNHIKEMIPMLKPMFGPLALFVFALGIMAAGTSSHLPNMMVIPWLSDDMTGFDWDFVPFADCGNCGPINAKPPVVIEENDEHLIEKDFLGRTTKLCKQTATIPLPMDFPVKVPEDWERIKHFFLFDETRIDETGITKAIALQKQGHMTRVFIPGGWDIHDADYRCIPRMRRKRDASMRTGGRYGHGRGSQEIWEATRDSGRHRQACAQKNASRHRQRA